MTNSMNEITRIHGLSAFRQIIITATLVLMGVIWVSPSMAADGEMSLMELEWLTRPGELVWVSDPEKAKGGDESMRWDLGIPGNYICVFPSGMHDLSSYEWLHFWAFSEEATGANIAIQFLSPNENQNGDYYLAKFVVDWTGWKEINLPWVEFKPMRNPAGWNAITHLQFITHRFGAPRPGTVLYVSDIRLTSKSPD